MGNFRKRPVEIEAFQISADSTKPVGEELDANTRSIAEVSGWMMAHGLRDFRVTGAPGAFGIAIETLEGTMTASPGDWIIRGIEDEFYPCKPAIFAATYFASEKLEEAWVVREADGHYTLPYPGSYKTGSRDIVDLIIRTNPTIKHEAVRCLLVPVE